jgi:hypothetical protein
MLSYVKYTPRYLKISTLTGVSKTNFVMLMTSSTIFFKSPYNASKTKNRPMGGGKQCSDRLVDRKLCTLRGVLWECVVKCMWRQTAAT